MRRAIATLIVLTSLAGCGSSGSDGTTGPGGPTGGVSISGVYLLKTVDSKPLPATLSDSTFLSGQLTVTDSGWRQILVVRYAQGGAAAAPDTLPSAGRYSVSGSAVTFRDAGLSTVLSGSYTSTAFNLTTKTGTLLVFAK